MGAIMGMYDSHIPSFLQDFNLRFGPKQTEAKDNKHEHGGISEITELQKSFKIFKSGTSFSTSCKMLGLGGLLNNDARKRWYELLEWLDECASNKEGVYGGDWIVEAVKENLEQADPLPCFMTTHDGNTDERVIIGIGRPLHYIRQDYLTISLPLIARNGPSERNVAGSQKKSATLQKKPVRRRKMSATLRKKPVRRQKRSSGGKKS